jgi:Ser/Thr protein kinase RdoA (MazF antagonist)
VLASAGTTGLALADSDRPLLRVAVTLATTDKAPRMCESPARCNDKGLDPQMYAATAEVLDQYELSEVVSLARLRSRTNENYLLTTRDGRYVLRSSHRSRSLASLAFEHRLLYYLAGRGFPAIAPLPSREMKTCVAFDGGFWTLFRYADGEQLNRTHPSHLTEAARALAMYHRFARGFERSDEQRAGTLNIEHWFRTTVETSLCLRPAAQPEIEEARTYLVENLDCLGRDLASPDIATFPAGPTSRRVGFRRLSF